MDDFVHLITRVGFHLFDDFKNTITKIRLNLAEKTNFLAFSIVKKFKIFFLLQMYIFIVVTTFKRFLNLKVSQMFESERKELISTTLSIYILLTVFMKELGTKVSDNYHIITVLNINFTDLPQILIISYGTAICCLVLMYIVLLFFPILEQIGSSDNENFYKYTNINILINLFLSVFSILLIVIYSIIGYIVPDFVYLIFISAILNLIIPFFLFLLSTIPLLRTITNIFDKLILSIAKVYHNQICIDMDILSDWNSTLSKYKKSKYSKNSLESNKEFLKIIDEQEKNEKETWKKIDEKNKRFNKIIKEYNHKFDLIKVENKQMHDFYKPIYDQLWGFFENKSEIDFFKPAYYQLWQQFMKKNKSIPKTNEEMHEKRNISIDEPTEYSSDGSV